MISLEFGTARDVHINISNDISGKLPNVVLCIEM